MKSALLLTEEAKDKNQLELLEIFYKKLERNTSKKFKPFYKK